MPLPTLTWAQGALHTNTTSATGLGAMTTLLTALTAATKWDVVRSNLASSPYYIEIKPTSADVDVAPCRILFAVSDNNDLMPGQGCTSPATDWTGNGLMVDSRFAVGCAPNGGLATFNTAVNNINNRDPASPAVGGINPYDGTAACRWSGYGEWTTNTDDPGGNRDIDQVYILESEESICVIFKNLGPASGPYWWACIAGAIWTPPTDADGESGTGSRLWGICAGGNVNTGNVKADLANNTSCWPNNGAAGSGNTGSNGVFDPNSVDAKTIRRMMPIEMLVGAHTTPYMTTQAGTIVHLGQAFRYDLASKNYVGVFRQMRKAQEAADRTIVQDAAGNDQAYIVSASLVGADGFAFDNG